MCMHGCLYVYLSTPRLDADICVRAYVRMCIFYSYISSQSDFPTELLSVCFVSFRTLCSRTNWFAQCERPSTPRYLGSRV